ncbi:hypothetical protein ACFSKU_09600 [Pontibacter silvestris]|uniref:Uncharacterized protein n=1 Tax=Pontibacter silvestris TaxID=2305183 RepID=A0ABW4WZ32_9BACT|nr:hypothetical protein [Pontibacter silvestris]MCC9137580.1 hypothetical protein [Pontibacter silvestris]
MKQNKNQEPLQQSTKDSSSDVEKVKQGTPSAPPQSEAPGTPKTTEQNTLSEDEEAEKGHA